MGKIFLGAAAFFAGIGTLFAARAARGDVVAPDTPAGNDIVQGSSPLGIGNNNPFNLEFRPSIQWRGQLGANGRFAVFSDPLYGIRAGMININTKFVRDGSNTVRKLCGAPPPPPTRAACPGPRPERRAPR